MQIPVCFPIDHSVDALNGIELDKVGMNGSGLNGSFVKDATRAIPNVIGITKKPK